MLYLKSTCDSKLAALSNHFQNVVLYPFQLTVCSWRLSVLYLYQYHLATQSSLTQLQSIPGATLILYWGCMKRQLTAITRKIISLKLFVHFWFPRWIPTTFLGLCRSNTTHAFSQLNIICKTFEKRHSLRCHCCFQVFSKQVWWWRQWLILFPGGWGKSSRTLHLFFRHMLPKWSCDYISWTDGWTNCTHWEQCFHNNLRNSCKWLHTILVHWSSALCPVTPLCCTISGHNNRNLPLINFLEIFLLFSVFQGTTFAR